MLWTFQHSRVACIVPFCRRTCSRAWLKERDHEEFICGEHYRLVDARLRSLRRKVEKRMRRAVVPEFLERMSGRLWDKAKAQAIERAGGLA